MNKKDVLNLYTLFDSNNIKVWIDGGWGVDALIGKQTRPHNDLDIAIERRDVVKLRNILRNKGFREKEQANSTEWNFVMENNGKEIDIHVFEFDDKGNNIYGIAYPKESLVGIGTINRKTVRCVSAEYAIKFRENYKLKEKDLKDVKALRNKFNLI